MVSEITIRNYRNVSIDTMVLGKWNLLIGPNGSGKSNFLRALGFWASIVQNKPEEGTTALYQEISQRGWERILNFQGASRDIDFSWVFSPEQSENPYKYQLKLHIGETSSQLRDFYIASESLSYANPVDSKHDKPYSFFECHNKVPGEGFFSISGGKRKKMAVRNNEVAFLQLDELRDFDVNFDKDYRDIYSASMRTLSKYLSRFYSYSCSDFNLKLLQKPVSTSKESSFLSPDAGNLVNLLLRLKEERDAFYEYRQMIAPLFGHLSRVDIAIEPIPGASDARLVVEVGRQRYFPEDLSDGTLRAMVLAALLVNRENKMSVCCIDEPEINLHPEWQNRFCNWLLSSDASQQYFISSHSPEIVDALTPAFMDGKLKVFVFSDEQSIVELTTSSISELHQKGFNLGDLYRAKAIEIGGWPK